VDTIAADTSASLLNPTCDIRRIVPRDFQHPSHILRGELCKVPECADAISPQL
jgi:hypothetical protein